MNKIIEELIEGLVTEDAKKQYPNVWKGNTSYMGELKELANFCEQRRELYKEIIPLIIDKLADSNDDVEEAYKVYLKEHQLSSLTPVGIGKFARQYAAQQ